MIELEHDLSAVSFSVCVGFPNITYCWAKRAFIIIGTTGKRV